MFGYEVVLEQTQLRYEHEGVEFGSWKSENRWSIGSIVTKVDQHPDVVSPIDFPSGSNALIVWIQWGSGDSFGHSSGANAEAIGIFKDMDSAVSLKKQIEEWSGETRDNFDYSYKFTTPDGQEFKSGYAPWAGYFESLEDVNIDVVAVF